MQIIAICCPRVGPCWGQGPPPPLSPDKSYARCTDRVVFCHRMDTVVQTGTWCTLANAGYPPPPSEQHQTVCMYQQTALLQSEPVITAEQPPACSANSTTTAQTVMCRFSANLVSHPANILCKAATAPAHLGCQIFDKVIGLAKL